MAEETQTFRGSETQPAPPSLRHNTVPATLSMGRRVAGSLCDQVMGVRQAHTLVIPHHLRCYPRYHLRRRSGVRPAPPRVRCASCR